MDLWVSIAVVVGAYVVGSVPTSYLVGRIVGGVDIRKHGSGNLGASNLTSQVGSKWAAPVVIFDIFIKGSLPVLIASDKVLGLGLGTEVAAGFAGISGHNWSIFTGFNGGRGMATVLGAVLALNFPLLIVYGSVPALGVLFTPWKDSAVWWLLAVTMMPVWAALLNLPMEVVWFSVAFGVATGIKRMTSNSLRGKNGSFSVRMLATRLVFDRDISNREAWIEQ
ncbi:glycerol-3-phosphate acyltransferase [Dehalococcoides mccartyi]|nr:glycerol-3-phosphate acyltransferase [Dehalococcoides mccartyi]